VGQYVKDQIKCSEDNNKLVIAIDAFDKYKTTFPFFINPPKSATEGATLLVTKLTAALVHGFGAGVYCFWATDQLNHDTNLTIEVVRRTLLKIEELHGPLPRRLYLQLDNASENKSAQFLAFITEQTFCRKTGPGKGVRSRNIARIRLTRWYSYITP
jgi:hypothetical protein